jgi:hypothetical protein
MLWRKWRVLRRRHPKKPNLINFTSKRLNMERRWIGLAIHLPNLTRQDYPQLKPTERHMIITLSNIYATKL